MKTRAVLLWLPSFIVFENCSWWQYYLYHVPICCFRLLWLHFGCSCWWTQTTSWLLQLPLCPYLCSIYCDFQWPCFQMQSQSLSGWPFLLPYKSVSILFTYFISLASFLCLDFITLIFWAWWWLNVRQHDLSFRNIWPQFLKPYWFIQSHCRTLQLMAGTVLKLNFGTWSSQWFVVKQRLSISFVLALFWIMHKCIITVHYKYCLHICSDSSSETNMWALVWETNTAEHVLLKLTCKLAMSWCQFVIDSANFLQCTVSLGRLSKFLDEAELDEHAVGKTPDEGRVNLCFEALIHVHSNLQPTFYLCQTFFDKNKQSTS